MTEPTRTRLTQAQAKRWIRAHWADFIRMSDCPMSDASPEVWALWGQECQRIAHQIDGKSALSEALRAGGNDGR